MSRCGPRIKRNLNVFSNSSSNRMHQFTYPVEQDPRDVLFGRVQLLCPQDVKNKVSHTFTAAGTDSDILERRLADLVVRHALEKKGFDKKDQSFSSCLLYCASAAGRATFESVV